MQGNVRSIDALRDLRVATLELASRCGDISFDMRSETERAIQWVTQDAPQYWRHQRKLTERGFQEACDSLAAMQATVGGRDKPACTELKKRVRKLRARLQLCDEKLALCKRWAAEIERGASDMVTATTALQQQAETGLPVAAAQLETWIAALDRYTETSPAARSSAAADNGHSEPTAAPAEHPDRSGES